jgi:hypothetical protein
VLLAGALGVLSLLTPIAALADRTTIDDPAGDVLLTNGLSSVDISGATAKHDGRRLVHVVRSHRAFDSETPERAACVEITADGELYRVGCESFTQVVSDGVFTGSLQTTRSNERTIRYEFGRRAIDRPDKYRWRALMHSEADVAPDIGTVKHKLN